MFDRCGKWFLKKVNIMEVEAETDVKCPFCHKKFTTPVTVEVEPPERDEL
jgi:hypothetical protein